ncbi:hypothetical protein KKA95_04915 [Patescibacteria group bacterium]|nr:hypothetical protein [Patescibacteria group bacterium]
MKQVPTSLRIWFTIHFAVDMIFAFPLLFAPEWTLGLFGISMAASLTARLVGAALIGIGGVSLVVRHESADVFHALLTLKILWSLSAMVAILLYISEGGPQTSWIILSVFLVFFFIWVYYKNRLGKN